MPDTIDTFDLIGRYFSSRQWLIIFVGSVIYLFFRVNSSRKRAIIGSVVIVFLFINSLIIRLYSGFGENGTFYRHLWAIPTMVIIGFAAIDLIRILPKWFLKVPAIAFFAILLWYTNANEYIRCRDQSFSADAVLVPQDVLALGEGFDDIKKHNEKEALYVVCPIAYERSYGNMCKELSLYCGYLKISDSSILNNTVHNGEAELLAENPDIDYIMSVACSKGMDYLIASRNSSSENEYLLRGYSPEFITDTYMVFRCSGYKGYIQDINKWGQTSYISYYNENGEPDLQEAGYCSIQYRYDVKGNRSGVLYYGSDGRLCIISSGYAGERLEYNNLRKCIKQTYLDINENDCNLAAGYSTILRTYNANGLRETQRYVDKEENPVLVYGCFETRFEYNEEKQLIRESYYDETGLPMLNTAYLCASTMIQYDDKGNAVAESYYDLKGNSVKGSHGFARVEKEYNENKRVIRELYLDEEGKSVMNIYGFAEVRRIYNEFGEVVEESHYNTSGEKIN